MTDRTIKRVKTKPRPYSLRGARGLYLWVLPKGGKVWRFRCEIAGQRHSVTLGSWPAMRCRQAKEEAQRLRQLAEKGIAPTDQIRRRRWSAESGGNPTLQDFARRWMAEIVVKVRKNPKTVERYLEREIYPALGRLKMAAVTSRQVQKLIFAKRDAGRPEAAAALRHVLKRLFDYGRACEVVKENPVQHTPLRYVTKHKTRTRYLSKAELRLFLPRCRELGRLGWALELLLLTLARKSELRQCRKEHVNLEAAVWEMPREFSKNGQEHIFYLSPRAVMLMRRLMDLYPRSELVLPMWESIHEPLSESALNKFVARTRWGFPKFCPHDLRRTGRTHLAELGYLEEVIEKALNHTILGVKGAYNRAHYGEQRRRMLNEWADYLERLAG